MADRGNMSSPSSSKDHKRDESSDDTANRLPVDEAKATNMEPLVISAAPNRRYLPPDIVEEILRFLPFKSNERFKSVSKSLFSLLAIRFNVPKLLYYPYITNFPPPNYGMISDYSQDVRNQGYVEPELLPAGRDRLYYFFIGSCNGLVCLDVSSHYGKWEIFVWNPFTSVCRKFPSREYYAYGFGYDSASDDYKVFAATAPYCKPQRAKVEILSLKSGSWKTLKNPEREYLKRIIWSGGRVGLFLNGALHWSPRESSWGEKGEIIAIAFDLDKEKFYHVPSPPNQISRRRGRYESSVFGVVGEYLCSFHRDWSTNIIWVMKEYCNEASWVPFISYTSSEDGREGNVESVCDFIPRSFKDGRYMMLEFPLKDGENIHVLNWNNNLDDSDEAGKYSKKIKFYTVSRNRALPYTQTLTSPYAS
ncbi:hypothetical protein Tsubulata_030133 [Turnera subulata]|uniref:F-box domain-containing protein n=1 Tax=Turnera subulata TaxID=218843 RepID=A0A9Q0FU12_9ROSI|nr:hypothetical protein Tsubulata_030133 [Turnera subulata]